MPVRVNTIHKPSEEMRDCRRTIDDEAALRASLRLQATPEYVESQVERLDAAIEALEAQKAALLARQAQADEEVAASYARSDAAHRRYLVLKHRKKIERMEELMQIIQDLTKKATEEN